jgi:hypothetical protein
VWALGALGYLAATGRPWRTTRDLAQLLAVELGGLGEAGAPARLEEVEDPTLRGVLALLLEPEPEDRPEDGAAVAALLSSGERPNPSRDRGLEAAAPEPRRGPGHLVLGAVLAIGAGLLGYANSRSVPAPPTSPPVRRTAAESPDPTRRLEEARLSLVLGHEDFLDEVDDSAERRRHLEEAFGAMGVVRQFREVLDACEAVGDEERVSLADAAVNLMWFSIRFRRAQENLLKRRLDLALGGQPEGVEEAARANLQALAEEARDRLEAWMPVWRRGDDGDRLRIGLALVQMDGDPVHARRLSQLLVPKVAAILPRSRGELGVYLARDLGWILKDEVATHSLPEEMRHDFIEGLGRGLRQRPAGWRDKEHRQVLELLLEGVTRQLRWAQAAPSRALLSGFDDLLEALVEARAGEPGELAEDLEEPVEEFDGTDLLDGNPSPEFRERKARLLSLARRRP